MHDRPCSAHGSTCKNKLYNVGLPQSQTSPQAISAINGEMCRTILAHSVQSLFDDEESLRHKP